MKDSNSPLLEGIIKVTGKGVGYFPNPADEDNDFEVQPERINAALTGDTVKVKILDLEVYGRKQAEVVEIIERKKTAFVGTLEKSSSDFFFIADDKRMYRDIHVAAEKAGNGKDGDKVQVKIISWIDAAKSPEGEVIRVIGRKGEHNAEMLGIIIDKGFEADFPADVEAEARSWKQKFESEDHIEGRKDFRNTTTFTIDPADAKDFDDAISFKKLTDGTYEIGIHIADVSHFVVPGTALDREAVKRATSIYLVDRTIPMLPEILSNDLCSLNPNEDKYAFSAVFVMDTNAQVKERWFGRTLIISDKRFAYEEAQEVMDKKEGVFVEELLTLNTLAKKLKAEKFAHGAIEFETDEVKFVLDDKGKPIRVYKKTRTDVHKLIEEFMLLANKEVAKYLSDAHEKNPKIAGIYRIHNAPDKDKIMDLATFVKALGFELKHHDGETTGEDISNMLKSVEGSPSEALIKTATIRSMQKAIYSTSNIGHFGLAFKYYTHFTSPIRRYPDVMVHRLLNRLLTHGMVEENEIAKYQFLCDVSTEREIEASEAERASIKYKQVEYMQEHIGEEFDAVISGVSEWGVYVEEVNTKAEGMVRLKNMTDDFYELHEKQYAVVGKNTGKKYSLGDEVRVKLIASDPERKTLDFAFVLE
ncbi:MAG: ribonuclease [Parcubacteria group bacterium]|nr:ribonuclease [Parcubacteria group bacterium]